MEPSPGVFRYVIVYSRRFYSSVLLITHLTTAFLYIVVCKPVVKR
jgi:hypothetical protein